ETAEFGRRSLDGRAIAGNQIGMILEVERLHAIEAGFAGGASIHEPDRQELVELGERAQQGDAWIEMRTGAELDVLLALVHPVRDRHEAWNAEIGRDVEHPQPVAVLGEERAEIADVGIVERVEIELLP